MTQTASLRRPQKEIDHKIQEYLNRRQLAQAETLIREKLKLEPGSPDGYYLMGVLCYFNGQVGKSIENLQRSLQIDPRHTDAAICLSVLFNDIGKYDDAKRVFEKANQSVSTRNARNDTEIDRKFAVKHLEIADLYFRYRRYDEAIEEYGKAALLDPTTLDIRIRRAKAYAKKGFLTRAIQELQQLRTEKPDFIAARIQLGLLHYSQGNILDAELEWEKVLEFDRENKEVLGYLNLARESRLTN